MCSASNLVINKYKRKSVVISVNSQVILNFWLVNVFILAWSDSLTAYGYGQCQ